MDDSPPGRAARVGCALAAVLALGASPAAFAAPTTVGVFVGSNRPGGGQQELQFAIRDAERMRAVLSEIGGLRAENALFLTDPSASDVLDALETQEQRVRTLEAAGEQTVFVFYYSGHARSDALTLGPTELELSQLRPRLESVGSTVTLAVLDACQAGAFSGIKGVAPGGEFSYVSTETLRAEGLVVMASSTATELSQESTELGGSFFTHHLVTGLRGAADRDEDGSVSLDEAYAYAYHRTLVTTAPTRVGEQHVTLETRLRGKGEMVLTRPVAADAWLLLDGAVSGRLLVVHEGSGTVAAEVVKEPDSSFSLALPSGRYRVVLRQAEQITSCRLRLAAGSSSALSKADCEAVAVGGGTVKSTPGYRAETLLVEIGVGALASWRSGPFFERLSSFGFVDGRGPVEGAVSLSLAGRVVGRGSWVVTASTLGGGAAVRRELGPVANGEFVGDDVFRWSTQRITASLRYTAPLRQDRLLLALQAGAGPTTVGTSFVGASGSATERRLGAHAAGSISFQGVFRRDGLDLGPFLSVEAIHARVLENLLGERGNVGGVSLTLGVRISP
ncbi:MAG: caspase family protein [Myxococcales bacterium]|nr:caspase family protein [Myxococcales bacterium]